MYCVCTDKDSILPSFPDAVLTLAVRNATQLLVGNSMVLQMNI